jgi:hypothetical protein
MSGPPGSDWFIELVARDTIEEMLTLARSTPLGGCFVEVGVYRGGSAQHLLWAALGQKRALYLYDTFEGMPHFDPEVDSHPLGMFADTNEMTVRRKLLGAVVVKGVFPQSALDRMLPIAFAHLDVDNYQSVKECGAYLAERIIPGGILWIDDSPCVGSAHKAAVELFGNRLQLSKTGKHFVRF